MKSKLFLLVSSVILIFITLTGFTDEPRAACTHLQTGAILYDLVHEYNVCSLCQEKIYTGNSRKLPHGNGRNGTCTQCGTHTYTGRTCVSEGVCECGATIAASGHTLASAQYSDATHPHAYFKYCTICDARVCTSGYATKNHGDGAWGSGTCPDCGSHTYVGQTCTTEGVCACGDTIPMLGHTLEGVVYSDASHPHNYFEYCKICWDKVYTGGSATKNHGDGTIGSGTCPQCGEHLYYLANTQSIHPHEATYQCDCGVSYKINTLNRLCAECTANTKIATDTAYKSIIFRSIDGGDGILIGLTAVLDCTVEYYNEYNEPCKNSIIDYGYPPFASLGSAVISSVTCTNMAPDMVPTLYAMSHMDVEYYSSSGTLIDTQQMSITLDHNARHDTTTFYILEQKPAYAIASAGFSALYYYPLYGYEDYTILNVTTYFD